MTFEESTAFEYIFSWGFSLPGILSTLLFLFFAELALRKSVVFCKTLGGLDPENIFLKKYTLQFIVAFLLTAVFGGIYSAAVCLTAILV